MSEMNLKQSNSLLRSLLSEYQSDPVTEESGVQSIIASIERLKESRNTMQKEFQKEKLRGEDLQRRLSEAVAQFQQCSSSEVPVLKQKLGDLQAQFDAIVTEMNVTSSLVTPLQAIVTKGHEDLRKCISREKEILATLTSKEEIDATVSSMMGNERYETIREMKNDSQEFTDMKEAVSEDLEEENNIPVTEIPDDIQASAAGHIVSDIPLREVTAAQLLAMNPFTLQGYAKKNHVVADIDDLDELRNEIWRQKQTWIMENSTTAEILSWNRAKLIEVAANLDGSFRSKPVTETADEMLRDAIMDEKQRNEWHQQLQMKDPVLMAKFERATNRQLVKWIKQYEPQFTIDGIEEDDLEFALFWKAVDIAVHLPA